jgi:ATP-dependent DNA helicase PIF1
MYISKMSLSYEQQVALQKFKNGNNLFITGPGGTGKTRLISQLVEWSKQKSLQYQVCAMTGCASVLLNCNARTLHSWSGIKLARGTHAQILSSVAKNKNIMANWRKIKVLIIDEISMMSCKIFEVIENIARIAKMSMLPFGGIQVIFTGDFYQLPPVGNQYEQDSNKFCFESEVWHKVFSLENHIRVRFLRKLFRGTESSSLLRPRCDELVFRPRFFECTECFELECEDLYCELRRLVRYIRCHFYKNILNLLDLKFDQLLP